MKVEPAVTSGQQAPAKETLHLVRSERSQFTFMLKVER